MSEEIDYEHDQIKDMNDEYFEFRQDEGFYGDGNLTGGSGNPEQAKVIGVSHKIVITQEQKEKYDKIRSLGRNFNNEWMVKIWHDYHSKRTKAYKLLYYDPK